jgi:hypothetical protein
MIDRRVRRIGRAACLAAAFSLITGAAVGAQTPTPSPIPPPGAAENARFDGLPAGTAPDGYPQLGFRNAPVSVTVYAAFDDAVLADSPPDTVRRASAAFFQAGGPFDALLERARSSDILITYLPIVGGLVPNGRGAARAALCAGEQGAFWPMAEALFSLAADPALRDEDRFAGTRLIDAVDRLDLNMSAWNACMISERPDRVLAEADAVRAGQQLYTGTPFVLIGSLTTLSDPASLNFTIDLALTEAAADLDRALSEVQAQAAATPEATPIEVVTLEPLMGERVPPPFTIALPPGWLSGFDTLVFGDIDAIRNVPFALYQGPVTGGTGTIVVLWGFPNLIVGAADAVITGAPVSPDLYADGSRLLRLAVVEEGCNIGTDLRRTYPIGTLEAAGTQWAAVDCPELPDTRGWFAGVQQYGLNFIFYAYAEPIEAMEAADAELQAILDSVEFVLPIPTAQP